MSIARWTCAALTILVAALVAAAVPAPAQEATKPPPPCPDTGYGHAFYDTHADHNKAQGDDDDEDVNLDLSRGWFVYDAAKGDRAVTANLSVQDMSDRLPVGSTTMAWNFIYSVAPESHRYVRRLRDFSGEYYEYGKVTPDGSTAGSFQYEGRTEGKAFPGRSGGVTIVVPKAAGAVLGKVLDEPFATTTVSKQAPGAAQPFSRGVSTTIDVGFDGAKLGHAGLRWKVGTCPREETFPTEEPTEPPPPAPMEPTRPDSGQPQSQQQPSPTEPAVMWEEGSGPLPVKLLTKRASRLKKGRTLVLELRASQEVTALAAQLRKGSKVLAKGRLAWLAGNAELKLKLTGRLRKGRYVLDLAGSDARGAHRFTQAWLRVR